MSLLEQYFVEMEAVAPYSFELTLRKPAGWWWSTPDEKYDNSTCWTATRFNHKLLGLKLQSIGTVQNPRILCTVFSKTKMDASQKEDLTQMLKRALKTEEDLSDFYKLGQNDPVLQSVVKDLYGMHTVGWPELFPALILAVTLQMAPMKRSDQMMDLLIANFGDSVSFDGKSMLYWPPAEKIAESSVEELKAKAKLGYRTANLVAIAKALTSGFPTMDE